MKVKPTKKAKTPIKTPKKSLYTVSTFLFESLEEAQEQMEHWLDRGILNEKTQVLEVKKALTWKSKIEII